MLTPQAVKLYQTRCEGLNCCGDSLVVLNDGGAKIDFDYIVINQAGTGEYQNAITKCLEILASMSSRHCKRRTRGSGSQPSNRQHLRRPAAVFEAHRKPQHRGFRLRQRRCAATGQRQQRAAPALDRDVRREGMEFGIGCTVCGHDGGRGEVWGSSEVASNWWWFG